MIQYILGNYDLEVQISWLKCNPLLSFLQFIWSIGGHSWWKIPLYKWLKFSPRRPFEDWSLEKTAGSGWRLWAPDRNYLGQFFFCCSIRVPKSCRSLFIIVGSSIISFCEKKIHSLTQSQDAICFVVYRLARSPTTALRPLLHCPPDWPPGEKKDDGLNVGAVIDAGCPKLWFSSRQSCRVWHHINLLLDISRHGILHGLLPQNNEVALNLAKARLEYLRSAYWPIKYILVLETEEGFLFG